MLEFASKHLAGHRVEVLTTDLDIFKFREACFGEAMEHGACEFGLGKVQ